MCQYCQKLLPKRKKIKKGLCLSCAISLWCTHESVLEDELRDAIKNDDKDRIDVLRILLDSRKGD